MLLVSVVIPLYNKEAHIQRTLSSVLAQKVQDFEILVIDDGSTDKSAEKVRSFADCRIRLIQQENSGVSAARNRGIEEAKADLIAFLDADDEWEPRFLETILKLRKLFPEAGAYSTACQICDQEHNMKCLDYKYIDPSLREGLVPNYFRSVAFGQLIICSSSVAIPKKIFLDVGGFPVGVWWGEDVDMWGRIALKYPIAFSWEIGACYHKEALNRACKKKTPVEEHCFVKTARKAINNGEIKPNFLTDLKEYTAYLEITTAVHNIFQGYNKLALKILINCETKKLRNKKILWILISLLPPYIFKNLSKTKRKLTGIYNSI